MVAVQEQVRPRSTPDNAQHQELPDGRSPSKVQLSSYLSSISDITVRSLHLNPPPQRPLLPRKSHRNQTKPNPHWHPFRIRVIQVPRPGSQHHSSTILIPAPPYHLAQQKDPRRCFKQSRYPMICFNAIRCPVALRCPFFCLPHHPAPVCEEEVTVMDKAKAKAKMMQGLGVGSTSLLPMWVILIT
jgi:hypothetical protein